MGHNSIPPQGSHPEILRYMGMGGLWRVDGGPCTAAEFEIKAETVESPW